MDGYDYITRELVEEQLAARRAAAARERLARTYRVARPPVRIAVGRALIRLGAWIIAAGLGKNGAGASRARGAVAPTRS